MPLPHFQTMPLGRRPRPFSHPDWFFEIKWDGFRSLVRIEHGESKLISRNGNEFKSFSALNDAIATEIRPITVLDGEIVCLDVENIRSGLGGRRLRLGEEPILNLGEFHECGAGFVVVSHVTISAVH